MRINTSDLTTSRAFQLSGNESWLQPVMDAYPAPPEQSATGISGVLEAGPEWEGVWFVRGRLTFRPWLDCSRCATPLSWPLTLEFRVLYQDAPEQYPQGEVELSREELDVYELEDGHIDLAALVSEQIILAVPDQVLLRKPDGSCGECGEDLTNPEVWSSEDTDAMNPFAVLKSLKDKGNN